MFTSLQVKNEDWEDGYRQKCFPCAKVPLLLHTTLVTTSLAHDVCDMFMKRCLFLCFGPENKACGNQWSFFCSLPWVWPRSYGLCDGTSVWEKYDRMEWIQSEDKASKSTHPQSLPSIGTVFWGRKCFLFTMKTTHQWPFIFLLTCWAQSLKHSWCSGTAAQGADGVILWSSAAVRRPKLSTKRGHLTAFVASIERGRNFHCWKLGGRTLSCVIIKAGFCYAGSWQCQCGSISKWAFGTVTRVCFPAMEVVLEAELHGDEVRADLLAEPMLPCRLLYLCASALPKQAL